VEINLITVAWGLVSGEVKEQGWDEQAPQKKYLTEAKMWDPSTGRLFQEPKVVRVSRCLLDNTHINSQITLKI
jgi:hypothetical protein